MPATPVAIEADDDLRALLDEVKSAESGFAFSQLELARAKRRLQIARAAVEKYKDG